jgi:hypothetical protein
MLSENNPTELHIAGMRAFLRISKQSLRKKRRKYGSDPDLDPYATALAVYLSATSSGWEQKQTISYVLAESEIV